MDGIPWFRARNRSPPKSSPGTHNLFWLEEIRVLMVIFTIEAVKAIPGSDTYMKAAFPIGWGQISCRSESS